MDGSKGYPPARYVRIIDGDAVEVEKGQAWRDLGPRRRSTTSTLEMTDRQGRPAALLSSPRLDRHPAQGRGREGQLRRQPGGAGTVQVQGAHSGSRVVAERWEKFYKPGKPYADKVGC